MFDLPVQAEEVSLSQPEIREININRSKQLLEQQTAPEESLQPTVAEPVVKVSALSLKSIKLKKELEQTSKAVEKERVHLTEPFTETDMLLHWTRYAQKLSDRGQKIMESYMLIQDPKLDGTRIIHELPNESSRIDFETEKVHLLGYLRGKLHNHDVTIDIIVNEKIENRKIFSNQDRYNRLHEINPAIELLRNTFGLELE